jgi:DNA invertase Pin-like site-specific DNA recombinase
MTNVAQWERRINGQRIKNALAVKRSQGVKLGRPSVLEPVVSDMILTAHRAGVGWSAIARNLNEGGVPTAHGGARWYPSTVRAVVLAREVAA